MRDELCDDLLHTRASALAVGAQAGLLARISFADKTTRVHHRVEALINGVDFPLVEVDLRR